ncbi:MAG: hypothetical protein EA369_10080 [Bradymonadales bacterium]|nr:MAG: hypothetical protein EA369_10080 [Bradymonadales bacterium]
MMSKFQKFVDFALRVSFRAPWAVVLSCFLLSAVCIWLAVTRLGLNTDLADMISDRLDFHKRWVEYKAEFPHLTETFVLVIEGGNFRELNQRASELFDTLNENPDVFQNVSRLNGGPHLASLGLLSEPLFGGGEMNPLSLQQTVHQFTQRPSLPRFFMGVSQLQEVGALSPLEREMADVMFLNQHELKFDFLLPASDSGLRQFIEVSPVLDYGALLPSEPAMLRLREIREEFQSRGEGFQITGLAALSFEEMRTVSEGALLAGILSLILVSLVLFWAFRSGRLIFSTILNLLVGLSLTAGFATLSIGHLNMISVAFAVLFIGLGVDYSIHLALRYREALISGLSGEEAIRLSFRELGVSLILCSITTAAAFFAFVPTAYQGVSELGLIAGVGMFINLFVHLFFFPSMLSLFPLTGDLAKELPAKFESWISDTSFRFPGRIKLGALVILIASLPLTLQIDFDRNPLNLQNPDTEAYQSYLRLMESSETSPWTIKLLKPSVGEIQRTKERLAQLSSVDRALSILDFVPSLSDSEWEVFGSFRDMAIPNQSVEDAQGLEWRALLGFRSNLQEGVEGRSLDHKPDPRRDLFEATESFIERSGENDESKREGLSYLRRGFVDPSLSFLKETQDLIPEERPSLETLAPEIKSRWISESGLYRVEVFPRANMLDLRQMRFFAEEVLSVEPTATDDPVTLSFTGDAVVQAFQQASFLAAILVVLLLFLMTRSIRDSFLILIPLVVAGAALKALMTLIGVSFNYANVIVLPLLIGIGVDSGVHILQRYRKSQNAEGVGRLGSSSRAVFFSSITTVVSFGTLSISSHPGTASMGLVLTLGTLIVMLCSLTLLPSLLSSKKMQKAGV